VPLSGNGDELDRMTVVFNRMKQRLAASFNPAREFTLLAALLTRPGAVLSRAQLEEKLYGWNEEIESNAIDVHLSALRRKLGARAIRNIRGVGWSIGTPEETTP
jgi:DNA-binding response OmpR family regulator